MPAAHPAGEPNVVLIPRFALGQRLEVVHVLRVGLAGLTHRSRAEVPDERTGLVVDLDHASGERRVGRGTDHRDEGTAVGHAVTHHAVRHDVAALRGQLVVDRPQVQSPAVALDVEDVDPAGEEARHEQPLLIVGVAVVVELVAHVRHVDAVHDLAEVPRDADPRPPRR